MTTPRRDFLKITGLGMGMLAGAPLVPAAAAPVTRNWVWIPNTTQRPPDEWRRRFAQFRAAGVTAILPEIYDGRQAWFESRRLPVKTDWLGTLLPLAHEAGLEVHAWMWVMPCLIDQVMTAHPDWYNVNALGESAVDKPAYVPYYRFLDPARPEVREWIAGTVAELAAIPGLAGIHLDYVRYPDTILAHGLWAHYGIVQDRVYPQYDYGYTAYERAQFKAKFGVDPLGATEPAIQQAWLHYRWDAVTGLVNDHLVPAAKRGGKWITAAVFPGPAIARAHVYQDWSSWRLDGFLPMLYSKFYEEGPEWVGERTREAVSSVRPPVYSGLFVGGVDDESFARSVALALEAGAAGIAVFADDMMTDEKWRSLARRGQR